MQLFIKNYEVHFINDEWSFNNKSYTERLHFDENGHLFEEGLDAMVQDNGDIIYQDYDDENQCWIPTGEIGKTFKHIILRHDVTKSISSKAIRELFSDSELRNITQDDSYRQ